MVFNQQETLWVPPKCPAHVIWLMLLDVSVAELSFETVMNTNYCVE